jgi:hypothetical protein
MRSGLASGSLVETVVTLAAAALMTFAGLVMVEDIVTANAGASVAARLSAASSSG